MGSQSNIPHRIHSPFPRRQASVKHFSPPLADPGSGPHRVLELLEPEPRHRQRALDLTEELVDLFFCTVFQVVMVWGPGMPGRRM